MLSSSSPFNLYLILSSENSQSPLSLFFIYFFFVCVCVCPYFCHCFGTCRVFGTYSDKYHPCTSMWALVSVVSSTTHTSLCDLYVLSLRAKSPFLLHMFSTTFPLLLSVSFYCCTCSRRITYNETHWAISTISSSYRVALTLYISSFPCPKLHSHILFMCMQFI